MTINALKPILAGILLAFVTACSIPAPKYQPSTLNVNKLGEAGAEPLNVGSFEAGTAGGDVNRLTIRGSSFVSPYDGSYVAYLKEALRLELAEARLLNASATVEVSGLLLKNELDASGFSKADAKIEARFIVKRGGQVRFDKVKSIAYEWESSFVGMVAIPRAVENYSVVVQRLLMALYSDPEFIAAVKK